MGKLGLEYLKLRAKAACPEYFDVGRMMLYKYLNPDFGAIEIVEENERYISDHVLTRQEEMILLQSPLGSGKTTIIKKLLRGSPEYVRILCITPRITFAHFISAELHLNMYLDKGIDFSTDRLAISVESLHKIKNARDYDVIILDEIEALLSIFGSPTLAGSDDETFGYLVSMIESAKKIILAGAFITKKTIMFMLSFATKRTICIRNTYRPQEKTAIKVDDKIFIDHLHTSIMKGEKNYVCYSSNTALKDDVSVLKASKSDHVKDVMANTLIYSSDSNGSMISDLRKIKDVFGAAALVMTTPKLTVGNSYSPKSPDFHNVFIRGSPTCIVADTFQSHFRVRSTINNRLIYSLPSKQSLAMKIYIGRINLIILEKYAKITSSRALFIQNTMRDTFQTAVNNPEMNCSINNGILKHILVKYLAKAEIPAILQEILMCNLEETTLSLMYYEE
jgi:Origin of replication binding protein